MKKTKAVKEECITLFVVIEVGHKGLFKDTLRVYTCENMAFDHANSLNKAYPKQKWIVSPSFIMQYDL